MFDQQTQQHICAVATRHKLPPAALLAIAQVESGGRVFAQIGDRKEPLIRFEGHYFHRHLSGEDLRRAQQAGLADAEAGRVKNPRRQAQCWELLNRAIEINRTAALSSTSWGIGQVMGSHWQWLGYNSVDALVDEARSGAAGQVELMVRYINKSGLAEAVRAEDWAQFARGYNGPGFAANKYDQKLARAFKRWSAREALAVPSPPSPPSPPSRLPQTSPPVGEGHLAFGARGSEVRDLQRGLTKKGYLLRIDGMFGLATNRAVRRFQRDNGLAETGWIGSVERRLLFPQPGRSDLGTRWRAWLKHAMQRLAGR